MKFSGRVGNEQMIKFWWQSGSRIRIMTLVRHALAQVCTVPVLLVTICLREFNCLHMYMFCDNNANTIYCITLAL